MILADFIVQETYEKEGVWVTEQRIKDYLKFRSVMTAIIRYTEQS